MSILNSIKDLPKDAQGIFEFVLKHLAEQNARSISGIGDCLYRFGDLSCAAGCLIPNDLYERDFDISVVSISSIIESSKKFNYLKPFKDLVEQLQYYHDEYYIDESYEEQVSRLNEICEIHKVTIPQFYIDYLNKEKNNVDN